MTMVRNKAFLFRFHKVGHSSPHDSTHNSFTVPMCWMMHNWSWFSVWLHYSLRLKYEVNYNSIQNYIPFLHDSPPCILSLHLWFLLQFYHGSLMIPDCSDVELFPLHTRTDYSDDRWETTRARMEGGVKS